MGIAYTHPQFLRYNVDVWGSYIDGRNEKPAGPRGIPNLIAARRSLNCSWCAVVGVMRVACQTQTHSQTQIHRQTHLHTDTHARTHTHTHTRKTERHGTTYALRTSSFRIVHAWGAIRRRQMQWMME